MHAVMGPSLTARRMRVRRAWCRGLMATTMVAVGVWHGQAHAAPATGMAAHRAVYDLVLSAVGEGDVVTAEGRLTFVLSDMCTAWSTQQQLHVRTVGRGGDEHNSDSDYAVLEDKDGSSLVFSADQTENGQSSPRIAGEAHMGPGGGKVHYTAPIVHDVALPVGTLFPVAHTTSVIAAGQAGRTEIAPPLFDGTVETGALSTYVLLLAREAPPVDTPFAALAPLGAQRVHMAYYNPTTRDMGPIFEQGMRYFSNGVADRLDLDFGQFRLAGTLREFRLLPVPDHCPAAAPFSPQHRPL